MGSEYESVRTIIAEQCPEMLPDFADKWSRWPVGPPADAVAERLRGRARYCASVELHAQAVALRRAAARVIQHAADGP